MSLVLQAKIQRILEERVLERVGSEETMPLDIGEGASVFLLIDLKANTWLQAVDPVLGVIMEEVFANAVSVGVR